jgi:penicillin-binding protein 2
MADMNWFLRPLLGLRYATASKATGLSVKGAILVCVLASISILLLVRLADIQLVRGESFEYLADANRFFSVRIPAERGVLLDRFGQPLVYNVPAYGLVEDSQARYYQTTPIAHEQALEIMAAGDRLVDYTLQRYYRYPESTAHVVGYTGPVTSADLLADRSLHLTDSIGKLGLERQLEGRLRGQGGLKVYEVDALGRRQRLVRSDLGEPGENIKTTIDPYLSEVAHRAMGSQQGSVVVMDADTGEVLVLVSTPTFNASMLNTRHIEPELERARRAQVESFFTNPLKLFFNRAVSGAYPPGSVFKPVTALAGLEAQAIDARTIVRDEGKLEVGEYSYANWYYLMYGRGEGDLALVRAMARSNDIYFYKAAEWTGPTKLAEMARLFGLGKKTGIELGGEAEGLVPDPAWKERVIGERWFLGNTYHFGIGQGDLLVSPLQIAQMTQTIAKNGTRCQPTLLSADGSGKESAGGRLTDSTCSELGVKEAYLDTVITGLFDACSPGGTASVFFARNQAVRQSELSVAEQFERGAVACKTGTAEFGGTDQRGRKKTHGWFTAIVKIEPQSHGIDATTDVSDDLDDEVLSLDSLGGGGGGVLGGSDVRSLHQQWLARVNEQGFPRTLVFAVMVESDEGQPYKEGSREAAPVVKALVDWMEGREIRD